MHWISLQKNVRHREDVGREHCVNMRNLNISSLKPFQVRSLGHSVYSRKSHFKKKKVSDSVSAFQLLAFCFKSCFKL